jgi:hypothetical protein
MALSFDFRAGLDARAAVEEKMPPTILRTNMSIFKYYGAIKYTIRGRPSQG